MPELHKKSLRAEILENAPSRPEPEVRVARDAVYITVNLPQLTEQEAEFILMRHRLRIVSKTRPETHHWIVPLPVEVDPARFVLRFTHGVLDVSAECVHGSH